MDKKIMKDKRLIKYSCKNTNSCCEGITFDEVFTRDYLRTRVSEKYYDKKGTQTLENNFTSISDTGFAQKMFKEDMSINPMIKEWRIGECMAECYLEDYHNVRFYYQSSRDAKNQEGNQHGADIVGFAEINDKTVFVFGEVKTSADTNSPPGVMYGHLGMICQMENIMDDNEARKSLIRWLAFKVQDKKESDSFRKDFEYAYESYYKSKRRKIKLAGILIRDTSPNPKDLASGYEKLMKKLNSEMFLHLSGIYLPIKIINMKKYLKKEDR